MKKISIFLGSVVILWIAVQVFMIAAQRNETAVRTEIAKQTKVANYRIEQEVSGVFSCDIMTRGTIYNPDETQIVIPVFSSNVKREFLNIKKAADNQNLLQEI